MTEAEWLDCTDPEAMLHFLRGKASDRKLRLFGLACCRTVYHLLTDERSRRGFEVAERYTDNLASLTEFAAAREVALRAMEDASGDSESAELGHTKWHAASAVAYCALMPLGWESARDMAQEARQAEACYLVETAHPVIEVPFPDPEADGSAHAELLRDIFGNPFRPLPPRPEVIAPLAEQIYAGAWDKMPLLGEWLQEHGYWSEGEHCLDPNIHHVKGCWVVDWVTGRE